MLHSWLIRDCRQLRFGRRRGRAVREELQQLSLNGKPRPPSKLSDSARPQHVTSITRCEPALQAAIRADNVASQLDSERGDA